jgi:hypothetical protein
MPAFLVLGFFWIKKRGFAELLFGFVNAQNPRGFAELKRSFLIY